MRPSSKPPELHLLKGGLRHGFGVGTEVRAHRPIQRANYVGIRFFLPVRIPVSHPIPTTQKSLLALKDFVGLLSPVASGNSSCMMDSLVQLYSQRDALSTRTIADMLGHIPLSAAMTTHDTALVTMDTKGMNDAWEEVAGWDLTPPAKVDYTHPITDPRYITYKRRVKVDSGQTKTSDTSDHLFFDHDPLVPWK